MSPEEIKKRSNEKLNELKSLLMRLQIMPEAKQKLSDNGFIENIVVFTDTEQYQVDPVPGKKVVTKMIERGPGNPDSLSVDKQPESTENHD